MSFICTFKLHSHFVLVKDIRPAALPALREAVRHQIQFTMVKQRGRFVRKMHKVFAAKNQRDTEYRFHINQLEYLYGIFGNMGIHRNRINEVTRDSYLPIAADFKMDATKVARENQVDIISYIVDDGPTKVVTLQTGQGKSQPLSAKILVPGGWSTMGEMHLGKEVLTPTGESTRVTGIYPQGTLEQYTLTCNDYRSTETSAEHLWNVRIGGVESIMETLEVKAALKQGRKVYIPTVSHADDYTPEETMAIFDMLSIPIHELTTRLLFRETLVVPDEFLYGHVLVRKQLIHILFQHNVCNFATLELANNMANLIRSLGQGATVKRVPTSAAFKESFLVKLIPLDEAWIRVKSVKSNGRAEMQCISIDSPESLYVTDDYIVTHNTFCGLKAGELIGERLIVQVLGRYFDKWVGDVAEAYNLPPERVVAIRGATKFKNFLDQYHQDPEGMAFDVLIITSKTIQAYMVEYELTEFVHLPRGICRPENIYESLGIGYRIIDEVHQHFHNNYKTDLYSHIPKSLYLSATMVPDDPFIKEMFNIAYPPKLRMDGGKLIRYTNVTSVDYYLASKEAPKFLGPQGSYNQIVYEEWIMKDSTRLKGYLELVTNTYRQEYIGKRKPGQKCLIFAGSIEMCAVIVNHLRTQFPSVSMEKYTAEDDYSNLMDVDTSVSTLGSSGTAVDIVNLSVCIMTTAVAGSAANIQAVGRLRELKNYVPDKPNFFYFTCMDIPKHIEYKNKKLEILRGRVLTHRSVLYEHKV